MRVVEPYLQKVYYCLALDPIHVGTGGYRLGEVDLTIVREPGTNLPKIPGSSLAGSARAYTAMATGKYRREERREGNGGESRYISCAGKGGEDGSEHCGEIDCPVCVAYGFAHGPQNRSFQGLAQFYDAQILFFPVHSMVGPVWVTAPQVLAEACSAWSEDQRPAGHQIRTVPGLVPERAEGQRRGLNLGWLFLALQADDLAVDAIWSNLGLPGDLARIKERLVLVPDDLFSLVVNNNLEVRTSVSIDPDTGAAKDGALFTFEALPRGTVLRFPVVYHDPQHYVFPKWEEAENAVRPTPFPANRTRDWIQKNVEKGLKLMEYLGVGGMNTRGLGRLRVLGLQEEGGDAH
ncbi:MAG TPA: type III-B CRISPR module RAMP protein Cmr4 [Anaerolineae bacterium]|nr:type III-B CRISPR module RAMP protein Cmr4 [Anaerolineae bacterium]